MARRTKSTREAVSGAQYRASLQRRADLWRVPLCACVAMLLLITVRVDLAAARGGLTLPGLSVGGADDAPRRTRRIACDGYWGREMIGVGRPRAVAPSAHSIAAHQHSSAVVRFEGLIFSDSVALPCP